MPTSDVKYNVIRSTRHHLLDANLGKREAYTRFLTEYSRVAILAVDKVWKELPKDLSVPLYLDYKTFGISTDLSARALSSIATQVSSIIRACVEKQRRRLWVRKNRNPNISDVKISKPVLQFVAPELSSKCCDIKESPNGKFWGYAKLKSLGKSYGNISLPIIRHPRMGKIPKSGVKFFKSEIQLAWDMPTSPIAKGEKVLGADSGIKTVLTLSDGQTTPKLCKHGHSYESILEKLSRKRKGSKAFRAAARHRKNFVNWSVNQLDFSNVREVRLEKVTKLRYRKKTSRRLSHWSYPEISDKLESRCEQLEVPIVQQCSAYRSQRCHQCGQVRKSNRKSKIYRCQNCGNVCDADLNAAINHSLDLPKLPYCAGQKDFFWNPVTERRDESRLTQQ